MRQCLPFSLNKTGAVVVKVRLYLEKSEMSPNLEQKAVQFSPQFLQKVVSYNPFCKMYRALP